MRLSFLLPLCCDDSHSLFSSPSPVTSGPLYAAPAKGP